MWIIHVCGCVNVFTFAVKFMWTFLHLSDLFLFLKYFSLKYFFYGWKQSTCTNMQPWKGNIPDKFFHAHENIKRRTWKFLKERGRRVRDRETSRTWWGWSMKSSVTFNKTRTYRKNRHDKKVDFFLIHHTFLYEDRRLTSVGAYTFIYLACENHQLI